MNVVIIGAGAAGLSIGWRLAQAGAQTTVLDRGQPGRGATWASAGMLAATAESGHAPDAEVAYARRSLALWAEYAVELEQAAAQPLAYRKDGALLVARDRAEADALEARAKAAGVAFISAAETHGRVPGLAADVAGALWAPDEAQVDNRALGQALATAFVRAGGRLLVNETAVLVEPMTGGGVSVRTPFQLLRADAVVLAAGAWSSQIEGLPPEAVPPVRPVKGEMIALRPPDGAVLPQPFIWGNGVYLVPRVSRLLVGATVSESGFDTSLTDAAQDWLLAQAAGLMPALADWTVEEHWAGLRPGSPDGLPIIGPTSVEGVYVASGQYRNGILLAPLIAQSVRTLVLEQASPPEIAAFNPRRFQNDTILAARGPLQ